MTAPTPSCPRGSGSIGTRCGRTLPTLPWLRISIPGGAACGWGSASAWRASWCCGGASMPSWLGRGFSAMEPRPCRPGRATWWSLASRRGTGSRWTAGGRCRGASPPTQRSRSSSPRGAGRSSRGFEWSPRSDPGTGFSRCGRSSPRSAMRTSTWVWIRGAAFAGHRSKRSRCSQPRAAIAKRRRRRTCPRSLVSRGCERRRRSTSWWGSTPSWGASSMWRRRGFGFGAGDGPGVPTTRHRRWPRSWRTAGRGVDSEGSWSPVPTLRSRGRPRWPTRGPGRNVAIRVERCGDCSTSTRPMGCRRPRGGITLAPGSSWGREHR